MGLPSFLNSLCGTRTTFNHDGGQTPRTCPGCSRSDSVVSAKARTWVEVCSLRLLPIPPKKVWRCDSCGWNVLHQPGGWQPTIVNMPNRPPPIGEQNHWYQIAEGWHQPPKTLHASQPPIS